MSLQVFTPEQHLVECYCRGSRNFTAPHLKQGFTRLCALHFFVTSRFHFICSVLPLCLCISSLLLFATVSNPAFCLCFVFLKLGILFVFQLSTSFAHQHLSACVCVLVLCMCCSVYVPHVLSFLCERMSFSLLALNKAYVSDVQIIWCLLY